ncbi:MAG: hypothetical protein M9892_03225 [Bacteroidetes bacterium]|nr:hypothetical protein [Bacteroidota bacterium]
MTTKNNKTETEVKSNEPMYVGKITAKEKEALEKEWGKITEIEVDVNESEISIAYYKEPVREVKAKAMSLFIDKKVVETGDMLIANCWLAGDKRQKEHPEISLSAAVLINQEVAFLGGRLKKS